MASASAPPRLLLVGGGGGFVGQAVLAQFLPHFRIRSVHRHAARNEGPRVEWVRTDVQGVRDWAPLLEDVNVVLNLAWYRWNSEAHFRSLQGGLLRLVSAAAQAHVDRFLQVSVPPAPEELERNLPYLYYKRQVDAAISGSGLSFRIVRPTMLFGPGDVLLSVMLRLMRRYPVFPMFGDGAYHVSPIAVEDLARILLKEAHGTDRGIMDLGGPERLAYRQLTDRMFDLLHKRPRYWTLSATEARWLTGTLVALGSTLLYPYEVKWLMSDMLGPPAYTGLDSPLERIDPYVMDLIAQGRRRNRDPPTD